MTTRKFLSTACFSISKWWLVVKWHLLESANKFLRIKVDCIALWIVYVLSGSEKSYYSQTNDSVYMISSNTGEMTGTVVSYQIESFSSKWELPSLLSPSFITQGRMEAIKAAFILMKNSHFERTPQHTIKICVSYFWRCPETSRPSKTYLTMSLFHLSSGSYFFLMRDQWFARMEKNPASPIFAYTWIVLGFLFSDLWDSNNA